MKTARWMQFLFFLLLATTVVFANMLSMRYDQQWDLSTRKRNSLHDSSVQLLQSLQGPITITAFVPEYPVIRAEIRSLINKYQQVYPDLELTLIDPTTHPAQARELGITQAGELLIEYQQKTKKISIIDEATLTNALAGLSMNDNRWIVEISGHGEPSLMGKANFDSDVLGNALKARGYRLFSHNLLLSGAIPGNTDLVVLSAAQSNVSDQEQTLLIDYLSNGGNLLWLAETSHPMKALQAYMEIAFLPGQVVDAAAADLGIDNPTVAIISRHVQHPVTAQLKAAVMLPGATAIDRDSPLTGWQLTPLLNTGTRSWNETGEIKGNINRDSAQLEQQGPLMIGALLTRKRSDSSLQQVIVIGDSDFLSNAYIGNGANRSLGFSMFNALTDNPSQISIPVTPASDQILHWTLVSGVTISLFFLFGVPATLAISGLFIRLRRSRQ